MKDLFTTKTDGYINITCSEPQYLKKGPENGPQVETRGTRSWPQPIVERGKLMRNSFPAFNPLL